MGDDNKLKANDVFNNKDDEADSLDICVVCQEPVAEVNKKRTSVKLTCGHKFHLDCIGSAFNVKNKMECPLCKQVEDGQWLFAQSQNRYSDFVFSPEIGEIPQMPLTGPDAASHITPMQDQQFDRIRRQIEEGRARRRLENERRLHGIMHGIGGSNSGGTHDNREGAAEEA